MLEQKLSFRKRGQLGSLQGIVLSLVVIGIILGAAFYILAEFKNEVSDIGDGSDNSSINAINKTIDAMTTIPSLLGLIVLIAIVGIILAIVFNVIPGARGGV